MMTADYLYLPLEQPLTFESAGQFQLTAPYQHEERIAESYEFIIGLSGSLHLQVGNKNFAIGAEEFVLVPPGTYYRGLQEETSNLAFYWCHFHAHDKPTSGSREVLLPLFQEAYRRLPFLLLPLSSPLSESAPVQIAMNSLLNAANRSEKDPFYLNYLVTTLLLGISDNTIRELFLEHITHKNRTISQIRQWINIHCHEHIQLEDLALEFGYNKTYLSRTFKKESGITITECINNARLEKAKNLLLATNLTVAEISHLCGFMDKSYFMRLFKAWEKITPTNFRHAYSETHFNND